MATGTFFDAFRDPGKNIDVEAHGLTETKAFSDAFLKDNFGIPLFLGDLLLLILAWNVARSAYRRWAGLHAPPPVPVPPVTANLPR